MLKKIRNMVARNTAEVGIISLIAVFIGVLWANSGTVPSIINDLSNKILGAGK